MIDYYKIKDNPDWKLKELKKLESLDSVFNFLNSVSHMVSDIPLEIRERSRELSLILKNRIEKEKEILN